MGRHKLRTNASIFAQLVFVAAFAIVMAVPAHAQAKPERQSKAVKPSPTTQAAQPAAANASDAGAAESSKPEEKAFKGMKYRMIRPFRGGRLLAAGGNPG